MLSVVHDIYTDTDIHHENVDTDICIVLHADIVEVTTKRQNHISVLENELSEQRK